MPTVREATFELFRAHGMTTIFGNPGSTELPMLADFPEDFNYVLGLQELVVVGMADGFAQATGHPTHVNLHTAPGVGNAVGGHLQRPGEQVSARHHRRAAGPGAGDDGGQPDQPRRDLRPAALRQMEPRAAAGPGCARARSPGPFITPRCRRAARRSSRSRWTTGTPRPTRTGRCNATRRRSTAAASPTPQRSRSSPRGSRSARHPGDGGRPRHRRLRRLGRRDRARREAAPARCGRPRRPAAGGSASRRTTPISSACCRRRSAPSPRRLRDTT